MFQKQWLRNKKMIFHSNMTNETKKAFAQLKELVKVSKILNQSSTYLKLSGFEFNGKTNNFLSYEDKNRTKAMIELIQDKLNALSDAIENEGLD